MYPPCWLLYHVFEQPKQTRVIATCSTKDIKALRERVLHSQTERYHRLHVPHTHTHTHYNELDPAYFVHVLYIDRNEYNTTFYNGELYQQVSYEKIGMTIANFVGELNISVFLDSDYTAPVMPNSFYYDHTVLHKCQIIPSSGYMVMHTGKGDFKDYLYLVIPLMMQQVTIQL